MKELTPEVKAKFRHVKLLALDVDGVLTDGGVYIGDDGREFRRFNIKDGAGLKAVMKSGIRVAIISSSPCQAVIHRADQLGITDVFVNVIDKLGYLESICDQYSINLNDVCFVGDDLADLPVMKAVGLTCAPADASEEIKEIADYITEQLGGNGAVREICNYLVSSQFD